MPIKKTYAEHGDACASAHGIELIGDVWTYPVLRELFLGPKRFSELSALLHGVTPAVLTARLRDLEAKGLVRRIDSTRGSAGTAYELTPWGHELELPLEGIARWAQSSPTWDANGGLTPDAAILAMKTMSRDLGPMDATLDFRVTLYDSRCARPQDYTYQVKWGQAGLTVQRQSVISASADWRCDSTQWAQLLFDPSADADAVLGPAAHFLDAYRASRRLSQD